MASESIESILFGGISLIEFPALLLMLICNSDEMVPCLCFFAGFTGALLKALCFCGGGGGSFIELVACPMMIDQLLYWHNTLSYLVLDISPNFLVVGIVRHLAG